MTVTYTAEVATCRGLGCFFKLLVRWKGSIYKLIWLDLIVFLVLYYILSFIYRFALDDPGKKIFESVVNYCHTYSDLIPLSFILGFYISIVMTRWWNQYQAIPFPDPLAVFVSTNVHGQDERGRVMRRTIMRYVCLSVTMMFTMISPRVKKRFPTLDHFIEAGMLQQSEKDIMDELNKNFPKYSKHWLPIVWAASIITRARKEGRIRDDFAVKTMIDELNKFRGQCGVLISYDTISVPLVYTQVVTLAVYSYFLTTLMAHQWIVGKDPTKFDLYFPFFTCLQFFFYVGWLKVAETLINPFGDDDDDFEVNWMVDRNLQMSYLIVDEMHHEHPELVRDQYWDEVFPQELPYTLASEPFREEHPEPSTKNIAVTAADAGLSIPSSLKVEDLPPSLDDGIHFLAKRNQSSVRMRSGGSQQSLGTTVPDSMPRLDSMSRVASVTNVLRRLFSREDSRSESRGDVSTPPLGSSHSSAAIHPSRTHGGSVRRIADEVIEEVDEQQMTLQSIKDETPRPTAQEIFGPPPPSDPVNVPPKRDLPLTSLSAPPGATFPILMGSHFGTSPPAGGDLSGHRSPKESDTLSIGSSATEHSDDDEFTRLKNMREKERKDRLMQTLARSISNQPGDGTSESDLLLVGRTPTVVASTGTQMEPTVSPVDEEVTKV